MFALELANGEKYSGNGEECFHLFCILLSCRLNLASPAKVFKSVITEQKPHIHVVAIHDPREIHASDPPLTRVNTLFAFSQSCLADLMKGQRLKVFENLRAQHVPFMSLVFIHF